MNYTRVKTIGGWVGAAVLSLVFCSGIAIAQEDVAEEYRQGKSFIQPKVYTLEEDRELLKAFEGLRVADVSDGMDKACLPDVGLMDPKIAPLWKDAKHFTHRIIGIAVTARYVPTNKPSSASIEPEEFDQWEGNFYNKYSSEPFVQVLREGSVLVLDDVVNGDVGTIGSNNIMGWKVRGCRGVVTNASTRDTDEIITEQVPLYFREVGRGIRPGRNEIESVNMPISCGGVLVMPGDVVVADGDGVIVVPRAYALDVARYAHEILEKDKAGRRNLYKRLGLPMDDSVR